jgi:hypothetical protein
MNDTYKLILEINSVNNNLAKLVEIIPNLCKNGYINVLFGFFIIDY